MQSIEPLHTAKRAGVSTSGNNCPFCFSGVDDCWETSCDTYGHYLLSLSHRDLARRCRPSQSMKYTSMLKIVTGLPWEHFQFRFTLLPSFRSLPHYALATSLCAPGMRQYRLQWNFPRFLTHLEPSTPNIRHNYKSWSGYLIFYSLTRSEPSRPNIRQ